MARTLKPRLRSFPARAFALIHPYWTRSDDRGMAWLLLVGIVGMTLGLVYLNVLYNYWNRSFFNAFENRDAAAFWNLIPYFFMLSAITVVTTTLQAYAMQMLQMRWRVWMTRAYLDRWLGDQSFYRLEQNPRGTDNPDQRIAEDLKQLAVSTVDLTLGFLHHLLSLVSFIAILWSLSSPISIAVFGVAIPGDLVWAALAYAVIGSAATYYVGRPLIGLRFQQERLEADMRFGLMRTREHAESIALYGGEKAERVATETRIGGLIANWRRIMASTMQLNALSSVYGQIAILFPYFLAAPRYFSGAIPLGGLTQIAGAFDTVRTSLSWFVFNYQALAMWKASVDRLLTFDAAVAATAAEARANSGIARSAGAPETLSADGLALDLPDGRRIIEHAALDLAAGDKVLLTGPPGAGKSTLFRALAGLWPHGSGRVAWPASSRVLFLPQKPYLPAGSLAAAVTYPSPPGTLPRESLAAALEAVGLAHLARRLDDTDNWSQVLSGGEQQQVAFARVLLSAPDFLFLDEATSALDRETEARLYALLAERLPRTAIMSIAHRPELSAFHRRSLRIDGMRLVPV